MSTALPSAGERALARRDPEAARTRWPDEYDGDPFLGAAVRGRMVDVGGFSLWVEEVGPADGTAVLMVQRMGAQAFEWEPSLCAAMAGAGYRVIRYDHRGFGWSEPGTPDRYTFRDLTDDAIRLVDALGIDRLHLFGTSMGGVCTRWMTLLMGPRVRSLMLASTSPGNNDLPVWSPEFEAIARNPPGPSVDARVDYLDRELAVMCDERLDAAVAHTRSVEAVARGWTMPEMRRMARAANTRTDAEREWQNVTPIEVPMAIVHGTRDPVLGVAHGEALIAMYPQASSRIIDGMGHEVQEHHVPQVWELLEPLLRAGDAT